MTIKDIHETLGCLISIGYGDTQGRVWSEEEKDFTPVNSIQYSNYKVDGSEMKVVFSTGENSDNYTAGR